MKLYTKILFALGMTLALSSCEDLLDQKSTSSMEPEIVFSQYELARPAIDAIYECYVLTSAYRSDYAIYYGANTDCEIWPNTSATVDERSAICRYKYTSRTSYLNRSNSYDFYPGVYTSIERANIAIKGLRENGDIEHRSQMASLLGEALTIRAVLYADLLNYYGEVPARFEPLTNETIYLPKSDKDVIYKQLLADLEEAASLMKFEDQTQTTRCSKACALGMYARLALQASGYSLRPDEGMVNTGDPGTIRKSSDPELQASVLYPKALAHLKEVIDCGKYKLYDNFEDLWHYYCNLKTNVDENNCEMIYCMPFDNNRGQFIYHNATKNGFLCNGSVRKTCNPALYWKFSPYDTRRDVTCNFRAWGKSSTTDKLVFSTSGIRSDYCYFGKYRFDWMEDVPYKGGDSEDGAKFPVLRYADIYLMAAEIANELGQLDSAKAFMEPVLKRAYHNDLEVEAYYQNLNSKDDFFKAVKDQRAFEFTGEFLRRQDLIRWGCLKEAIDSSKVEMKRIKNRTEGGPTYGLRDAIYYKINPDNVYDVEMQFVRESDPEPAGWTKKASWFSGFNSRIYDNIYLEDPDQHMYRPIPSSVIIASLGTIVNDYGYTEN
ncbi:MAG: RagB/SusD family nutrient uptake outer membrane protein [Bacteroidales bacterium]|nr:RagB/SusD family nutrient uptake outer membrane protein [Bacteroidales bacterium]